MQPSNTNAQDYDMFEKLRAPESGQDMAPIIKDEKHAVLQKILHPPSSVPQYAGLPTNEATTMVNVEWRNTEIMNAPRILVNGINCKNWVDVQGYTDGFNVHFLIPASPRIKSWQFINDKAAGKMVQDVGNTRIEQLYDFKNWAYDANKFRMTYKSTTIYPNMTYFNNIGLVAICQFNPSILFSGLFVHLMSKNMDLAVAYCKMKLELNFTKPVKISNNERELHEKWDKVPNYLMCELRKRLQLRSDENLDLDPNVNIQIFDIGAISDTNINKNVPSPSQILGQSARSIGFQAKDGAFVVQRLNTVSPPFLSANTTYNQSENPGQISGLYECLMAEINSVTGVTNVSPLFDNIPVGTPAAAQYVCQDAQWPDTMTWAHVAFYGLQPNAGLAESTTTVNQMFIQKTITGLEVQPQPRSAWAGTMKLSPRPDLSVMQAIADAFYQMKDGDVAKANFWGEIWNVAKGALGTFGSSILKELAIDIGKRDNKTGKYQNAINNRPRHNRKTSTNSLRNNIRRESRSTERRVESRVDRLANDIKQLKFQRQYRGDTRRTMADGMTNRPPPPPALKQRGPRSRARSASKTRIITPAQV
jgi:hypothetical protein